MLRWSVCNPLNVPMVCTKFVRIRVGIWNSPGSSAPPPSPSPCPRSTDDGNWQLNINRDELAHCFHVSNAYCMEMSNLMENIRYHVRYSLLTGISDALVSVRKI